MFAFYDTKGEILAVSNVPDLLENVNLIPLAMDISPAKFYIKENQVIDKPKLVANDDQFLKVNDILLIENVPPGTTFFFEDFDNPIEVNDGKIEIEFLNEGNWEVLLFPSFPYQNQVLKVSVQ